MWRANACPLWLFALLSSRLVWYGMGQALAFFGAWVPGVEDILTSFILSLAGPLKCPGSGQVSTLDGGLGLKGIPCLGASSGSPSSLSLHDLMPGMEVVL